MTQDIVAEPLGFEWDRGNSDKNFIKHGVRNEETEEVFLNQPLVFEDEKHSKTEKRYDCLGVTNDNKKLFISFTIRSDQIRVISARLMNKKERIIYDQNI